MVALAVVSGLATDFRTVPAVAVVHHLDHPFEILIGRNAGQTLLGICFLDNGPTGRLKFDKRHHWGAGVAVGSAVGSQAVIKAR